MTNSSGTVFVALFIIIAAITIIGIIVIVWMAWKHYNQSRMKSTQSRGSLKIVDGQIKHTTTGSTSTFNLFLTPVLATGLIIVPVFGWLLMFLVWIWWARKNADKLREIFSDDEYSGDEYGDNYAYNYREDEGDGYDRYGRRYEQYELPEYGREEYLEQESFTHACSRCGYEEEYEYDLEPPTSTHREVLYDNDGRLVSPGAPCPQCTTEAWR